jgi:hypothetical protein
MRTWTPRVLIPSLAAIVTMSAHASEEVWRCQITYARTWSATSGLVSDERPEVKDITFRVNSDEKTCNGYDCFINDHERAFRTSLGTTRIDPRSGAWEFESVFGDGSPEHRFGGSCSAPDVTTREKSGG